MTETKEANLSLRDCDVSFFFPDCVLVEILVRLPLKPIFKFKVVSKHWLSLISDPFFRRLYESRYPSKPWALLCYSWWYKENEHDERRELDRRGDHRVAVNEYPEVLTPSSGFSLLFPPKILEDSPIRIMASHNGLLLCCQMSYHLSPVYFCICNPFNKQYVILPEAPSPNNDKGIIWDAGLIVHDDGNYKVARILRDEKRSENLLKVEIFASETGRWKELYVPCPLPRNDVCFIAGKPVLYNGIFHFYEFRSQEIITYDPCINNNQVHSMTLPWDRSFCAPFRTLAVSDGHLCCIEMFWTDDHARRSGNWRSWVLTNYETGQWSLKHEIKYTDMSVDEGLLLDRFVAAEAVHPFDLNIVYFRCYDDVVCFNFQTRKFVVVCSGIRGAWAYPFEFSPWPTMIAQPSWNQIVKKHSNNWLSRIRDGLKQIFSSCV